MYISEMYSECAIAGMSCAEHRGGCAHRDVILDRGREACLSFSTSMLSYSTAAEARELPAAAPRPPHATAARQMCTIRALFYDPYLTDNRTRYYKLKNFSTIQRLFFAISLSIYNVIVASEYFGIYPVSLLESECHHASQDFTLTWFLGTAHHKAIN